MCDDPTDGKKKYAWLSGKSSKDELTWFWETPESHTMNVSSRWDSGVPFATLKERCLCIMGDINYNSKNCMDEKLFLCKRPLHYTT